MTKKKVLLISVTYIAYFFLLLLISWQCYSGWCQVRDDNTLGFILFVFSPLAPVFLFSLITYPLREETFRSWLRFAKWWVPMSMLLVLITPDGQGGGYMPSLIDKQVVAFLTSVVFIIISTVIIVYRSLKHAR